VRSHRPALDRRLWSHARASLRRYVEIPSDNVPFNTTPAMKAPEITAAGIEALRSKRYDVRTSALLC